MAWRSVVYVEQDRMLALEIQPMLQNPCCVYVPDDNSWRDYAPDWSVHRKTEIVDFIKAVQWNRALQYIDGPCSFASVEILPGSLESTEGGQRLLSMDLFRAGSEVSAQQAKEIWCLAARKFAEAASGEVNIFRTEVVEGSVFEEIELPVLKSNPNVNLVMHSE